MENYKKRKANVWRRSEKNKLGMVNRETLKSKTSAEREKYEKVQLQIRAV